MNTSVGFAEEGSRRNNVLLTQERKTSTLLATITDYLKGVTHVKPITLHGYGILLRPPLDVFGPDHLPMISQQEVNDYTATRRKQGAGRTIIKELKQLRYAQVYSGIDATWSIPRSLSHIPRQERYTPTPDVMRRLLPELSQNCRLAVLLASLAGLRPKEVLRVTHEDYDRLRAVLTIQQAIRKCGGSNAVPVCTILAQSITDGSGPLVTGTSKDIDNELYRVSKRMKMPHIRGLQAFRRFLVSQAEDAGYYFEQIALVTGHTRSSMASRYSNPNGHMELKRKIIEDVERTLAPEPQSQ